MPRPRLHQIRFHGVLAPNAELRALVVPAGPQEAGVSEPAATEPELRTPPASPHQLGPAAQARVRDRLEHCPNCGGGLEIIAAIMEAPVIERILAHLGLQARAPPRAPAREQMQRAA